MPDLLLMSVWFMEEKTSGEWDGDVIYFILDVPARGDPCYLVKLLVGAGQNRLPPITGLLLLQISTRSLQLSFISSAACCRITSLLPTYSHSTEAFPQEKYISPGHFSYQSLYFFVKTGFVYFCSIIDEGVALGESSLSVMVLAGIGYHSQGFAHVSEQHDTHSSIMWPILILLPWVEQHRSCW